MAPEIYTVFWAIDIIFRRGYKKYMKLFRKMRKFPAMAG
jgi:hypothetical protein